MIQGQSAANYGHPISHPGVIPAAMHSVRTTYPRHMFPMTQAQPSNYGYGYSGHAPQTNSPVRPSMPITSGSDQEITKVRKADQFVNPALDVEIRCLYTLAGVASTVTAKLNGDHFIFQDGKKMGKISVDEVRRIAGSIYEYSHEIIPLGHLFSEQLFGQIVGREDEKDFTFIKLFSPIERISKLVREKIQDAFNFYSMGRMFHVEYLDMNTRIEMGKYILGYDFIKNFNNLSSKIFDIYGDDWPYDIENYADFMQMIYFLKLFTINVPCFDSKNINDLIKRIYHSRRSIDVNGRKLEFYNFFDKSKFCDFDILSVDKSDDKIRFKILFNNEGVSTEGYFEY